ncbi:Nif-specific regulatory protein [Planctomycetes bacterium Poly30]|uniref:Nif-specific regulatory protein n=1 Tax=Saltatorellus ferox TaxID=2528018 RepID=A0A518EPS8_9BACT|nr:Nif-specific regulatory protein [Planctomycetes bacterium Poly30]
MSPRPTTIISLLGIQLDKGWRNSEDRWRAWRPTVGLCMQDDLEADRLLLLASEAHGKLARVVKSDIESVSPTTSVELVPIEFEDPWDFAEVYGALREFADSRTFDPEQEDLLVHMTTGTHVAQICLFLLVETGHLPGRLIQTSPPKGESRARSMAGEYTIIDLDLSRYDRLAARFELERREGVDFLKAGIETRNPAFNALMERIERVALRSEDPILLSGATGVGKTQLARRIFELKQRHAPGGAKRLVEVNCATLRGDQAMSALFGHEKGAFTGAMEAREGLLRAAHGGALFLDEIGELGLDEQAMLLRAIEEKSFLPVGSDDPVSSSFQLIAGTNRDLGAEVREGNFREDLLARIDLWTFELPSLKNRLEDLEPNLDFELAQLSESSGKRVTMGREARESFLRFAADPSSTWRANFRDFGAAITRMATLSEGGRITPELAREECTRLLNAWARLDGKFVDAGRVVRVLGAEAAAELDRFDRVQLEDVLEVCAGARSMSEAGRILFAASRAKKASSNDADRLRKYLARFGLHFKDLSER